MKKIYLTVDTECHNLNKSNLYIDGFDGKEKWGLQKILELGKDENIPINFFLDVGEATEYGEEFIWKIVNLIHEYKQPIFFHLHPDYISGDHSRTFLWEYNYQEKKIIFEKALLLYKKFVGQYDKLIFRAGRYGVDSEFYDILAESGLDILDLSYLGGTNKMCHLNYNDVGVINKCKVYKGIKLLPNTRFIALDLFGIKRAVGLDTAEATLAEFKRYLKKTQLSNIVLTMHSWNFIRKWFFVPNYFLGDKAMVRKFHQTVQYAKSKGFIFSNLNDFLVVEDSDEMINMCEGISGKLSCLINNFMRFHKIARLNKKYFLLYSLFYLMLIILLLNILVNFR